MIGPDRIVQVLALALVLAGCAVPPPRVEAVPAISAPMPAPGRDAAIEDRILALDPDQVSAADVRDTLTKGPTPRVMLLHGGIFPVHLAMESFGEFLVAMGYPEARIRSPADGTWSEIPMALQNGLPASSPGITSTMA